MPLKNTESRIIFVGLRLDVPEDNQQTSSVRMFVFLCMGIDRNVKLHPFKTVIFDENQLDGVAARSPSMLFSSA